MSGYGNAPPLTDADCEGQALAYTDVCLKWGCGRAPLVKLGRYWGCSRCGSSYGEHAREPSPLVELVGMLEAAGCSVTSRFGGLSVRHLQRRMVKDAAFIIRKEHGLMHHSTARRLALALFREGLLNFYLYRNVPDGR